MNALVSRLLFAFTIQCAIVAAVFWPRYTADPQSIDLTLTPLEARAIGEIEVSDDEGNAVQLKRSGEHWLLPSLGGLRANAAMVNQLLHIASKPAPRWPVANTESARQRFSVAQYLFQRRIVYRAEGAAQVTVLLGTSPGFRQVHARNAEHDEIYSIAFNNFEAPTDSAQWLATDILQVRAPLRIVADSYSVNYTNGIWQSGSGGTPDERELNALLDTLRSMHIKGTASADEAGSLARGEPELTFSIESLGGDMELGFFKLGQMYFVHSSDHPYYFGSNAYDFDRLAGIDFSLISGTE